MHRSRIRSLVTAVLASGLAWTTLPAVVAAPVTVVPSALPAGPSLQVASIDPASHVLSRPGQAPVTVLPDGGWADSLLRVRGGYLVSVRWDVSKRDLVLVGDDGSQRVIRDSWTFAPSMVASDGRSFIAVQHRLHRRGVSEAYVVRRFRVQDGQAVGKPLVRPYDGLEPRALTVTPTAVTLVTPHPVGRYNVGTRTERWTTRTGRTRVLSESRTPEEGENPRGWAASMAARVVGVDRGPRQVALDARTRKPLWRTRAGEALLEFSPDGRSVVTVSDREVVDQGTIGAARRYAVRSARTGEVLVELTGFFTFRPTQLPSAAGFAWETSDSFITFAYDDIVWGDDSATSATGGAMIRCTVSTASCERVGDGQVVPSARLSD